LKSAVVHAEAVPIGIIASPKKAAKSIDNFFESIVIFLQKIGSSPQYNPYCGTSSIQNSTTYQQMKKKFHYPSEITLSWVKLDSGKIRWLLRKLIFEKIKKGF
jgi:hypothetical protein